MALFCSRFGCPPASARYFVHDDRGNVIAELTTAGAPSYLPASGRTREYIYLPEAEIAPTISSRTQVDIPVAVVDAVIFSPAFGRTPRLR